MSFVPGITTPVSPYPFGMIDPARWKGVFDPFAIPVLPTVAQQVYLLYSYPVDDDGVEVEIKVASSDYGSQPGDTPADFEFDGKLLEAYSLSNSIIGASGAFSGSVSAPAMGRFVVLNPFDLGNPSDNLDFWLGLNWEGRTWKLFYGDYNEPLGTILGRGPVNVGKYGAEPVGREDRIVLQPRDLRSLLDVPLQPNRYLGLDQCLEFASGAEVAVTGIFGRTNADEITLECMVKPSSLPTAGNYAWLMTYGPDDARCRVGFKGDALVFERSGNSYELVAPTGSAVADQWQSIQVRTSLTVAGLPDGSGDQLELRVDGEVVASDSSLPWSSWNRNSDLVLGDATESYVGLMDEVRVWDRALDDNEMHSNSQGSVSVDASDLIWYSHGVTDNPVTPTLVIDELTTPDRDYADIAGSIDFGDHPEFELSGPRTFELIGVIIPDNTNSVIFSKSSQWDVETSDANGLRCRIHTSSGTLVSPWVYLGSSTTEHHVHIGVRWQVSTSTLSLFVNGSNATSVSATPDSAGTEGLIVRDIQVGEVRVWSESRTAQEIAGGLESTLSGTEANLELLAGMAGDSTDATANGYDGTDTSVTYGDTNGAITGTVDEVPSLEGTEEMAGQPKPLGFGPVQYREPVLIDPANLVYQIHDGAIEGNVEVVDRGSEVTNDGDTTDLVGATVTAGTFKTDVSRGLIRLGSISDNAVLRVTFDGDNALGSGVFSALRAEITRRCFEHAEVLEWPADFDTDSFDATDLAYPYRVSLYTGTKDWTLAEALEWLSQPFGLLIGRDTGVLSIGVAEPPEQGTADELYDSEVYQQGTLEVTPLPVFSQVQMGYGQIDPIDASDLAGALYGSDPNLAQRLQREFLSASSGPRMSPVYKEARSLKIDTPIVDEKDALSLANHGRTLRGVRRKTVKMAVGIGPHKTRLNTVKELGGTMADAGGQELCRYSLEGVQGLVGAKSESGGSENVEVTLWV